MTNTEINTKASEFKIITDSKDEPNLKEAQEFVGGMVEGITFPNGDYLIINEEGKLMQLPLNPEATALWRATFDNDNFVTGRKDFVVGPAILIKKDEINENYGRMQHGLTWFQKNNVDAYYKLLD